MPRIHLLVACLAVLPAFPVIADDQGQLCVNQCLFHHGPASNPRYHACVAEMCETGAPAMEPTQRQATPAGRWTNQTTQNGGAHSAAVEAAGKSFNYICQRGGPGLIGMAGFGSNTNVTLQIGGQQFRPPSVAQNGILYTAADPGSALLGALLAGSSVEVAAGGQRASFTLTGSGAAIRKAMAGCGLRP